MDRFIRFGRIMRIYDLIEHRPISFGIVVSDYSVSKDTRYDKI